MAERSKQCSSALDAVEVGINRFCAEHQGFSPRLLDVGCWDGEGTQKHARILGAHEVHGVEYYEHVHAAAVARGIKIERVDIERERFPYEDALFDVVICNQVFEHLKNIYLPTDEIARVMKPGAELIFSVPNLASLHNRILLALGRQPTSIRLIGPHVRSFTPAALVQYFETTGLFQLTGSGGNGFPPLPRKLAALAARALPTASHSMVFRFERTDVAASAGSYAELGAGAGHQTVF